MEGLVLKFRVRLNTHDLGEAPRGGAGIEIVMTGTTCVIASEAPRGGAGIEISAIDQANGEILKPLVEGLVLKFRSAVTIDGQMMKPLVEGLVLKYHISRGRDLKWKPLVEGLVLKCGRQNSLSRDR